MKKQKQDTLSLKRRNLTTSETRETKWEAWANIKEGVTTASNNHSKETRTNMKDFPENGTKDTKKETKPVLSSNTCTQGNGWTTSFYIGSWSGVPPISVTMVGGLPGASVKKNCVKELTEEQFSHLYKQMEIIWSDMSDSWIATWCMYFFVWKRTSLMLAHLQLPPHGSLTGAQLQVFVGRRIVLRHENHGNLLENGFDDLRSKGPHDHKLAAIYGTTSMCLQGTRRSKGRKTCLYWCDTQPKYLNIKPTSTSKYVQILL